MGLPTTTPTAKKLWQVSQLLKCSPFDPTLLEHTEAQLDFILEMYATDHPDEYTFVRQGDVPALSDPERRAAWDRVLTGSAKTRLLPRMPLAAMKAYEAALSKAIRTLKNAVGAG